jgi:hypothetical protein
MLPFNVGFSSRHCLAVFPNKAIFKTSASDALTREISSAFFFSVNLIQVQIGEACGVWCF